MTTKDLVPYSNKRAINAIFGSLMKDPTLIRKYNIQPSDFPETFHKLIFAAINNLSSSGAESIGPLEIDEYLSHYDAQYIMFKKHGGNDYVQHLIDAGEPENIQYNYEQLKKFSLLRKYVENGIDVSWYFDPTGAEADENETRRKRLDGDSITDIINHFRSIQLSVSAPFRQQDSGDSKKAGVGGAEQKEKWKQSVAWGLGYSSAYLTEALHGLRRKTFTVKSAGTGVGKTRTAIGEICYACVPYYYDKKRNIWAQNPNGTDNRALYIGTEMELLEEIDPILWAYIADVPQDHIKYNEYAPGEEERVDRAIQILEKESNIWLEYRPEFTVATLEDVIEEHVLKHGVQYVWFDYIHTNPALIAEFQQRANAKMAIREDQVLLDLSSRLKQMARDYDICLNSATQVNGSYRDEKVRDQSLIAGGKAIANKADNALTALPPTANELSLVAPILEALGLDVVPNLVYTLYKVREGRWNKIKIWLYIDYSTMRTHDLFVTGEDYNLIPAIQATYINRESDKVASTEKSFLEMDDSVLATVDEEDW